MCLCVLGGNGVAVVYRVCCLSIAGYSLLCIVCAVCPLQAILSQVHVSSDSGLPAHIQLANTSGGIFTIPSKFSLFIELSSVVYFVY